MDLRNPSRRLVFWCGLATVAVVCFFVLLPCALREANSRAVLGRDISRWKQIDSVVRVFHMEHGRYPASLEEPDFQSSLSGDIIAFLGEGRVAYHPPAPDSPPTFILVRVTTPRGDISTQLDGTPLYPASVRPDRGH
jgi:hypothetical protein